MVFVFVAEGARWWARGILLVKDLEEAAIPLLNRGHELLEAPSAGLAHAAASMTTQCADGFSDLNATSDQVCVHALMIYESICRRARGRVGPPWYVQRQVWRCAIAGPTDTTSTDMQGLVERLRFAIRKRVRQPLEWATSWVCQQDNTEYQIGVR